MPKNPVVTGYDVSAASAVDPVDDRWQRYWAAEQRRQDTTYTINIGLHITNLESRDILVSKARLHYRGSWMIRMERDISLVDPSEGTNIQGLVKAGHMTYGQVSGAFTNRSGTNRAHLPLAYASWTDLAGRVGAKGSSFLG
jgi:hypothetical protein